MGFFPGCIDPKFSGENAFDHLQQQMGFGLGQQWQRHTPQQPRKYTHRNSNWIQQRIRQLQQMKSASSQAVFNVGANNQNVVRDIVM